MTNGGGNVPVATIVYILKWKWSYLYVVPGRVWQGFELPLLFRGFVFAGNHWTHPVVLLSCSLPICTVLCFLRMFLQSLLSRLLKARVWGTSVYPH